MEEAVGRDCFFRVVKPVIARPHLHKQWRGCNAYFNVHSSIIGRVNHWTEEHMPAACFHFPGRMHGNNKTGQPNWQSRRALL